MVTTTTIPPSSRMMLLVATSFLLGLSSPSFLVRAQEQITAPEWVTPSDGGPFPPMTANVGDTINFFWSTGTHSVFIHPTMDCNQNGRILVGRSSPATYTFVDADGSPEGTAHLFVSDTGTDCEDGMQMTVTVLSTSGPTATPLETDTPTGTSSPAGAATTTTDSPTLAPSVGNEPCFVCGNETFVVTNPNGTVTIRGEGGEDTEVTCTVLYEDGLNGAIPARACNRITSSAAEECRCAPPGFTCSICGDGFQITNTNREVDLQGDAVDDEDLVTCGQLEEAGNAGLLLPTECAAVSDAVQDACGCAPIGFNCSICGEGQAVMNPDVGIELTNREITCETLETAGLEGELTPDECDALEAVVAIPCGCAPIGFTCSICGDGQAVTALDGNITIPGEDSISCGEAELLGKSGELTPTECEVFLPLALISCECDDAPPTETPSVAPVAMSPPGGGDGSEPTVPQPGPGEPGDVPTFFAPTDAPTDAPGTSSSASMMMLWSSLILSITSLLALGSSM